jgi:hypothetical protein
MRPLPTILALLALAGALAACTARQAPWSVNCENQAAARHDPGFYAECMRHE